jgi:hypothetical protein
LNIVKRGSSQWLGGQSIELAGDFRVDIPSAIRVSGLLHEGFAVQPKSAWCDCGVVALSFSWRVRPTYTGALMLPGRFGVRFTRLVSPSHCFIGFAN